MLPGDILLVDDYSGQGDLLGNLIRAGGRARYGDSDPARWTHSALIVSAGGDLVEALAEGVRRTHIAKYAAHETLVVSPPIPAGDPRRTFAVSFALARVGSDYDRLDFVSLAASLLTGLAWSLHSDRSYICSGEVSRATESYTTSGYPYPPEAMLPADLAVYWKALSGDPLPPLSFLGRMLDTLKAVCWALSPFTKGLRPVNP